MAKVTKFEDSGCIEDIVYSVEQKTNGVNLVPGQMVLQAIEIILRGVCNHLKLVRTKENDAAITFTDFKDNIIFAVRSKYTKCIKPSEKIDEEGDSEDECDNEEGDESCTGFSVELTFNPDDITGCIKYKFIDELVQKSIVDEAKKFGVQFRTAIGGTFLFAMQSLTTILNWLDKNADANETVSLELPGYFIASVDIIDDKKVMSIIPGGELKQLIKDDPSIQVL